MDGQTDIIKWILTGIAAGATGISVFLMKHIFHKHDELFKDFNSLDKSHNEHKLHVSENYAKKHDVLLIREETRQTLERIHVRLDELPKTIIALMESKK